MNEETALEVRKSRQKPNHMLTQTEQRARVDANAKKRELSKPDQTTVMKEYRGVEQASRDQREKLREERLAREASAED
jgi:hypothetical protein